jgi:hypothetical protein
MSSDYLREKNLSYLIPTSLNRNPLLLTLTGIF